MKHNLIDKKEALHDFEALLINFTSLARNPAATKDLEFIFEDVNKAISAIQRLREIAQR